MDDQNYERATRLLERGLRVAARHLTAHKDVVATLHAILAIDGPGVERYYAMRAEASALIPAMYARMRDFDDREQVHRLGDCVDEACEWAI